MELKNTDIQQLLEEMKSIYESRFKDSDDLKGEIEGKLNKFGLNVFYYSGYNSITNLGGGVSIFLNESQTDNELVNATIKTLNIFLTKRKEF